MNKLEPMKQGEHMDICKNVNLKEAIPVEKTQQTGDGYKLKNIRFLYSGISGHWPKVSWLVQILFLILFF